MRPVVATRLTRPLVVLAGDPAIRPDGLERELLRDGFQVAEALDLSELPARPALVVVTCDPATADCQSVIAEFDAARQAGAQVVVLLAGGTPEHLIHAAEAGADEAVLLPAERDHLLARLRARLISPRVMAHGPGLHDLRLFQVLQAVAIELHRDDMLHALVRGLSRTLGVRAACLLHTGENSTGRLVAASDAPKIRDAETDLRRWPESTLALRKGESVLIAEVAGHPAFVRPDDWPAILLPPPDLHSAAALPLAPLGRTIGTVVLRTMAHESPITPGHLAFAELAVAAVARLLETDDRRGAITRRQANAAHVDPLTGCGTLDALDRRIREEFERSRRYDVSFALVLLDVDDMRTINDRLGRDGGHRVLADLGRLLQRELRAPDFVARYGGEEFLLLLPETNLEGARQSVMRIREQLAASGLGDLQLGVRCNLTAGIAVYPHADVHKPEDLFAQVEMALQAGKHQEHDRIGSAA